MRLVLDDWLLSPARAALHRPTGTVIASDLHLGYDGSRQASGDAVPDVLVAGALAPLATLKQHGGTRLLIAGDLFEAGYRRAVADQLTAWCREVGLTLVGLIPGNHDRGLVERPDLPLFPEGAQLGNWHIVHGDGRLPAGPCVHGHEHPCLRLSGRVRAACFLVSESRLVLPAFSRDAAGVGVVGEPRWRGFRCVAIVGDDLLDFGDAHALGALLNGHSPASVRRAVSPSRSSESQ